MRIFLPLLAAIFFPLAASAQVSFSEIMYDLDGTDADREWIEVFNEGGSDIDLSNWKLREGDTDHKLVLFQGPASIPVQGLAIIASSPSAFLTDNPGFTGTIFDSVFSLSNTGETISLKDGLLAEIDAVSYTSALGAGGDGKTLQKLNGVWGAASPTPGFYGDQSGSKSGMTEENLSTTATTSTSQTSTAGSPAMMQRVFPNAGNNMVGIVGAAVSFEGRALNDKNIPLVTGRYIWNFGDGEIAEGMRVLHTYRFVGDYVVTLTVSDGIQSVIDTMVISVIEPPLSISRFVEGEGGYIELVNASNHLLDLSWWRIISSEVTFVIPDKTAILPAKALRFPNAITKIIGGSPRVSYPNGTEAFGLISENAKGTTAKLTEASLPKTSPRPLSNNTTINKVDVSEREDVSAAVSKAQGIQGAFIWYGALGGLLVVSVGILMFIRRSVRSKTGYEIVE